jgi:serine/threonine protein kinase
MTKSDTYNDFLTGNTIQEVQIDIGPFIEPHSITNAVFYKKRPRGLGELFTATYQNNTVICRKLHFSRISGYIVEDIKFEIEELKKINNPSMVKFYGAMMNLPEISLVFAELPKSLYRIFHEDKIVMSLKDKSELIRRICKVVQDMHNRGLAHGHLSSHNILIKEGKRPIISDFGLEKLKKYAGLTLNYTNKSQWTSPELLKDTSSTVIKAQFSDDVYSVGIIIWEIITGEVPYNDIEAQDFKDEICNKGTKPRLPEFFPKDLIKILKASWAPAETRVTIQDLYNKVTNMKLTN